MENNELQHWGIKGQKWGVRRYQNSDGTLTAAGKKRYNKELTKLRAEKKVLENKRKTQAKYDKLDSMRKEIDDMKSGKNPAAESGKKSIKDMSNEELSAAITRAQLEKNYRDLHPEVVSRGKKYLDKLIDGAMDKGADLALNVGRDYVDKVTRDALGLSKKKDEPSASDELKNLVNDLRNKRDAEELKDDEYQNLKRAAAKSNFEKQIRDNENAKKEAEKKKEEATKSETKSENKTESKREEKTVYEGTVVGEGTSKGSSKKSDTGPVVDVDWKDVTVSNVPAVYTRAGQDFVDDFIKKRK